MEWFHFSIEGQKGENYYHHFVAYSEIDEKGGETFAIAEFQENFCGRCCGIGEVKLDHYFLSNMGNNKHLPFPIDDSHTCRIENKIPKQLTNANDELNALKQLERAKTRLLHVLGDSDYDAAENNCEHAANYIMTGASLSDQAREQICCAHICNTFINSVKGMSIIFAFFICLVSASSGTIVRRAHEKLLIDLIITKRGNIKSNYSTCDNFWGKDVIESTRTLLRLEKRESVFKKYPNVSNIIDDIIGHLDTEEICNDAADLGLESFLKTTAFFLIPWIILQTVAILLYIRLQLIPLRQKLKIRGQENRFCKILSLEILSAYVPILISYGTGCLVQLFAASPAMLFFICTVAAGLVTRLLVPFVFACCTCCCCGCHDNSCGKCQEQCTDKCCSNCLLGLAIFLILILLGFVTYFIIAFYCPTLPDPI